MGHIAGHNRRGSTVDTGAGQQGDDGNDQIGYGGVFADPCHYLGICRSEKGGDKICHHTFKAAGLPQPEDRPAQSTS